MGTKERVVGQCMKVFLGVRGTFELVVDGKEENIIVLRHFDEGPKVVAEFPAILIHSLYALSETYRFNLEPVDIQWPQEKPRSAREILGTSMDENVPVEQVSVERRRRSDGKVDTIVTPVGLSVGVAKDN